MAEHNIALERGEVCILDPHRGELAEPGVDPVNRLAPGQNSLDCSRAGGDQRRGGGTQPGGGTGVNRLPLAERNFARCQFNDAQFNHAHWPLHTRAWSGFAPIR